VGTAVARLLLVGAFCFSACTTEASSGASTATPTVDEAVVFIEPGLQPKMRPDQLATIVFGQIADMERMAGKIVASPKIVRMTATSAAGVSRLEPGAGVPEPIPGGIQWVVRAEGTFTTNRGPMTGAAGVAASGFFLISDGNGDILGFGDP